MFEIPKCNCGKDAKYTHIVDGEELWSCNKYIVCPSYEKLTATNKELRSMVFDLIVLCDNFTTYKESSPLYNKALYKLEELKREFSGSRSR